MDTDSVQEPAESPQLIQEQAPAYRLHTGAKCPPEKRQAIMEHLNSGTGILTTASLVHASPNTVAAVRDQQPEWRQEQSSNLKQFTRMITRDMLTMSPEELRLVPLKDKAITLGVVMDKIALLDGEPTSIVEHRHSVDLSTLTDSLAPTEIVVHDLNHGISTSSETEISDKPQ